MQTIFKCTWITQDPQVFLGMVTHTQIVDTRPFFIIIFYFDERPGYEASLCGAKVVNFLLLPMHAVQQSCSYQKCCLGKLQIFGSGLSKPHTSKLN